MSPNCFKVYDENNKCYLDQKDIYISGEGKVFVMDGGLKEITSDKGYHLLESLLDYKDSLGNALYQDDVVKSDKGEYYLLLYVEDEVTAVPIIDGIAFPALRVRVTCKFLENGRFKFVGNMKEIIANKAYSEFFNVKDYGYEYMRS